jgi:hypothetical protein
MSEAGAQQEGWGSKKQNRPPPAKRERGLSEPAPSPWIFE